MTTAHPLTPGSHAVELDGVTQRYHVAGSGPVCLAHPGGPGIDWDYLRMPAAEEHLTMVYVAPIGTSGSDRLASHPHGYTRERYSRALDGLLDHLGVPQVFLLGHSHGGFVAQYYALKRADRLAGIILYESAPVTGAEQFTEAARNMDEFLRVHADAPGLPEVVTAWESLAHLHDDESVTRAAQGIFPAYFADYWAREDEFAPARAAVRAGFISGADEAGNPESIDDRAVLASITTRTLVLVGRHDVICGPRWATELAETIPGAELVVFEHSGHFAHLEEPAAFTRALVKFATA
ncbi:MAG: hydrolase [Amycolatopsis sp.]|uniref:alpha/beta fold hydrolase n=1 Tax=Amycolatopsis sp. TaxID=37632 RepID=UPI0026154407|nr:alpha/beta hydrolase [Amycolatopsis sp.]MCU1680509.1 hydrolase [Amycolatopsis sp.]